MAGAAGEKAPKEKQKAAMLAALQRETAPGRARGKQSVTQVRPGGRAPEEKSVDLLRHESVIRLGCFGGVLLLMAAWEVLAPRRRLAVGRPARWLSNLGLVALDTLLVRFLVPLGAVGAALVAEERGLGLLPLAGPPRWLAVVLAVVALDLVIYLQHVLFHALPLLWRLHRVHHADLDIDATTGVRFHPLEILASLGIKVSAVILLGAPALAVLLFEVLLNATSLFNHGNVRLPAWLDRILRLVVVTPEMHRVHHSAAPDETNSNFGFNLPWWDYLLGTYRAQPRAGHEGMTVGLADLRDERVADRLPGMLALPFFGLPSGPQPRAARTPPADGKPLSSGI
jgi:sterol desaturase/sphingolipid hydroxylase (fatty acid hydroxylase superfamily)